MNIGEKIYECRRQMGLSQEELGNKLDATRHDVTLWEANLAEPSLDDLSKLADVF